MRHSAAKPHRGDVFSDHRKNSLRSMGSTIYTLSWFWIKSLSFTADRSAHFANGRGRRMRRNAEFHPAIVRNGGRMVHGFIHTIHLFPSTPDPSARPFIVNDADSAQSEWNNGLGSACTSFNQAATLPRQPGSVLGNDRYASAKH